MDRLDGFEQKELQEKESSFGKLIKIDGSLVVVESMVELDIYELIKVGQENIIGEIIKLEGDKAYVQCFEDTSNLRVGDLAMRTKTPLQIELGPGIFKQIYDGLQRPLQQVEENNTFKYLPQGVKIPTLDQDKIWEFYPSLSLTVGQMISGGDIYGEVFENDLISQHRIMAPPQVQGRITYIAPAGDYTLQDKVLEVEIDHKRYSYGMSHLWSVRQSRPIVEKLECNEPLISGSRVYDGLFSLALGSACCISGPVKSGQKDISFSLAQNANTQCMIFIGFDENCNEMAEVFSDFPEKSTQGKNKQIKMDNRAFLIANPSHVTSGAREASIYTGITFAEYFRDQGLNVTVINDSFSKWVDTIRDIQSRIGNVITEHDYPDFLTQKLDSIYSRVGKIRCRGSPNREGSISLITSVNSTELDFTDPVTTATLKYSKAFWGMDPLLAKKKLYPSVNCLKSYSDYENNLKQYYNNLDPEFLQLRLKFKQILQEAQELLKFNKEELQIEQLLTLNVSKIIKDDFIYQTFFHPTDYYSPFQKTISMMKCIILYYESAKLAIQQYQGDDSKQNWDILLKKTNQITIKLAQMKFFPDFPSKQNNQFESLVEEIKSVFQNLQGE